MAEKKSCNWGHTKEAISRLVRGAETRNGPVPHPRVVVENWEGYLGYRGFSWRARGPRPTLGSLAEG